MQIGRQDPLLILLDHVLIQVGEVRRVGHDGDPPFLLSIGESILLSRRPGAPERRNLELYPILLGDILADIFLYFIYVYIVSHMIRCPFRVNIFGLNVITIFT